MSWKDAKKEATAWVERLSLPPDLQGQEIDLATVTSELPQKGQFREMVVRAVARLLKSRGAKIK